MTDALREQKESTQEEKSPMIKAISSSRITLIKRKVSPIAVGLDEKDDRTDRKVQITSVPESGTDKPTVIRPSYIGSLRNLIPEDWAHALRDANSFDCEMLDMLEQHYYAETQEEPKRQVYPPRSDIFRALQLCPLAKVRVVILGQDPYCGEGQAMGLSFSVKRGIAIPPSLQNIFKELKTEYNNDFAVPVHGDLTDWSEQGVLLLNSSLTVRAKEPGSHSAWEWQEFTDKLIEIICARHQHVVFLLWGMHAQNKANKIQGHYKLKAAHPSPKSAENGFFGCNHFKECNELLVRHGGAPIEWGKRLNGSPLPRTNKVTATMADFVKVRKTSVEKK